MKTFKSLKLNLSIVMLIIFTASNQICIAQEDTIFHSRGGFTKNMGQILDTDSEVTHVPRYCAEGGNMTYYLLEEKIAYVFHKFDNATNTDSLYRVDLTFINSKESAELRENDQLYYKNFYLAHTGANGTNDVGVFESVDYSGLLDSIEINCSMINGLQLKFTLEEGVSADNLKFYFDGADSAVIENHKILKIYSPAGMLLYDSLSAYQVIDNEYIDVEVRILSDEADNIYFVPNTYDNDHPLYIVLAPITLNMWRNTLQRWSTWMQGSMHDEFNDVWMGDSNNVYATGTTLSTVLPLMIGQWNINLDFEKAFVYKFNALRGIEWGSFFGGAFSEKGEQVVSNSQGYVYIAGKALSNDMFVCLGCTADTLLKDTNAYVGAFFIAKFGANGHLDPLDPDYPNVFATHYGGDGAHWVRTMTIDNNDNVYIGGMIQSQAYGSFPIRTLAGAYNQTPNAINDGNTDAFIVKIDSSNIVKWSTVVGGLDQNACVCQEFISGMITDEDNNLYVTGGSASPGSPVLLTPPVTSPDVGYFPLADPGGSAYVEDNNGITDAMVIKFNSSGAIEWSTMIGGSGNDNNNNNSEYFGGIAVSPNGSIYITGYTNGGFPIDSLPGYLKYNQSVYGGGAADAFIAMFDSVYDLKWSTYYGGSGLDQGRDAACGAESDFVYFTGSTRSGNFPVLSLSGSYYQSTLKGLDDAYILEFLSSTAEYEYAMWYGGSDPNNPEGARSIVTDADGTNIIFCGESYSNDFPFQDIPGNSDYFYNLFPGNTNAYISNFLNRCNPCSRIAKEMDNDHQTELLIYPNPSGDYINIFLKGENKSKNIAIYNSMGGLVKSFEGTGNKYYIGDLPDGLYLLRYENKSGNSQTTRFIVAK